ncbi:MAG: hypothetical protein EP332_01720 [Bacteroidetes bacterium]|nr:MAG: hypothetical protein EP332_01720 [Bacteroidota bacterium]
MMRKLRILAPALAVLLSIPLWAEELEEHRLKPMPSSQNADTSLCKSVNSNPVYLHDSRNK